MAVALRVVEGLAPLPPSCLATETISRRQPSVSIRNWYLRGADVEFEKSGLELAVKQMAFVFSASAGEGG